MTCKIPLIFRFRRDSGTPPIFDGFSPVHAYAVNKLFTNYDGSLGQIEQVTGGGQQDFGPDSSGFIDTAAIATHLSGDTGIWSAWYDQAENTNFLKNGDSADYVEAADDPAHPSLDFPGASPRFMVEDGDMAVNDLSDFTVFAFIIPDTTTGQQWIFSTIDFTASDQHLLGFAYNDGTGSHGFFYSNNTTSLNKNLTSAGNTLFAGPQLITWVCESGASRIRTNSVEHISAGAYTQNKMKAAANIGREAGSAQYFNGDILMLAVFDRALSTSELLTIEGRAYDTYLQNTNYIKDGNDWLVDANGQFIS